MPDRQHDTPNGKVVNLYWDDHGNLDPLETYCLTEQESREKTGGTHLPDPQPGLALM
jgi:hypothetical protein